MENLEVLIKVLKRELDIVNQCIPKGRVHEGLSHQIKVLEEAVEIYEEHEESLKEGCLV
jgi:hypothetical protein